MIASKPRITDGFIVGQRIELAPHTDRWMRGDRYGEVVAVGRKLVSVKMDRSGQVRKFHPSHFTR